jgi:hypothetical protein
MNEEQSELYERRRDIAEKISNYFGDDNNPNYGDKGYQDLLAELDEVNVLLSELDGIELDELN